MGKLREVRDMIAAQTVGPNPPKRVFLSVKDFQEFEKEYLVAIEDQFPGGLYQQKALEDGYMNYLFNGVAVCLAKDSSSQTLD